MCTVIFLNSEIRDFKSHTICLASYIHTYLKLRKFLNGGISRLYCCLCWLCLPVATQSSVSSMSSTILLLSFPSNGLNFLLSVFTMGEGEEGVLISTRTSSSSSSSSLLFDWLSCICRQRKRMRHLPQ